MLLWAFWLFDSCSAPFLESGQSSEEKGRGRSNISAKCARENVVQDNDTSFGIPPILFDQDLITTIRTCGFYQHLISVFSGSNRSIQVIIGLSGPDQDLIRSWDVCSMGGTRKRKKRKEKADSWQPGRSKFRWLWGEDQYPRTIGFKQNNLIILQQLNTTIYFIDSNKLEQAINDRDRYLLANICKACS